MSIGFGRFFSITIPLVTRRLRNWRGWSPRLEPDLEVVQALATLIKARRDSRLTVAPAVLVRVKLGELDRYAGRNSIAGRKIDILCHQNFMPFSRAAFAMTLTDDSAMAAAAMIGDRRMPNNGYKAPAAIGTPTAL